MGEERTNRDVMTDVIERFIRQEVGAHLSDEPTLAVIREQAEELTTRLDDAGLLRRSPRAGTPGRHTSTKPTGRFWLRPVERSSPGRSWTWS